MTATTAWTQRPTEERTLLNPAFCSMLLWQASRTYAMSTNTGLAVEAAFLVLPLVLHRETREELPNAITTSLPVWLDQHQLLRARYPQRAQTLVPFTREALLFGGIHGLLLFANGVVTAEAARRRSVNAVVKSSTDEVRACAKRAEFVGKWLAKAGTPSTVMAFLGVKP